MMPPVAFDAFESEDKAQPVNCVEEEYEWLAVHAATYYKIPDAFPLRQKVTLRGGKAFDTLYLDLPDGSIREYWFDVSSFYWDFTKYMDT